MSMRGLPPELTATLLPRVAPSPASHAGMLLFIQYAFMPNRLEYCGADDHGALYDYWAARQTDAGLAELLRTFTGALPYLKLIAHSNGLADPFDRRVVEAYWVGNALLDGVDLRQFYQSLTDRLSPQLQGRALDYLLRKVPLGARPHHSFHVFDVHSRVGQLTHSLHVMENCRISWGQITALEPGHFVIQAAPLLLQDGKLTLGPPQARSVARLVDDQSFTRDAQVGDWLSVHWGCACDILTPEQVQRLDAETRHAIRLANLTL